MAGALGGVLQGLLNSSGDDTGDSGNPIVQSRDPISNVPPVPQQPIQLGSVGEAAGNAGYKKLVSLPSSMQRIADMMSKAQSSGVPTTNAQWMSEALIAASSYPADTSACLDALSNFPGGIKSRLNAAIKAGYLAGRDALFGEAISQSSTDPQDKIIDSMYVSATDTFESLANTRPGLSGLRDRVRITFDGLKKTILSPLDMVSTQIRDFRSDQ